MASQQRGVLFAFLAYVIWGVFPIFWKQLSTVNSLEILMSRVIWSCFFTVLFLVIINQRKLLLVDLKSLLKSKGTFLRLFLASLFISVNWFMYIWAVNHDHILQSSLGYYINPLITVIFGVIFFKEKLANYTIVSLIIAAIGVLILTINYGQVPWISLGLAFSFAIYSVFKKKITLDATRGLAIETMFIVPFALAGYLYFSLHSHVSFVADGSLITVYLMLGGILTAIPLVLFAKGAQSAPLYLIGFVQYVSPTISFFVGVFVYDEPFTSVEIWSFSCIWLAVLIFSGFKMLETRKMTASQLLKK